MKLKKGFSILKVLLPVVVRSQESSLVFDSVLPIRVRPPYLHLLHLSHLLRTLLLVHLDRVEFCEVERVAMKVEGKKRSIELKLIGFVEGTSRE